mgnify:CR=1 FL=1
MNATKESYFIAPALRNKNLPKNGDIFEVKQKALFTDNKVIATVQSIYIENVNGSDNIRYTITTDKGVAKLWDYEIANHNQFSNI